MGEEEGGRKGGGRGEGGGRREKGGRGKRGEERRKDRKKGGVREIRLKVLLHFTFGCCKIGFMRVFQPVLASTNDGSISSCMTSDPEKVCYLLSLNFGLSWILSHNVLSS